MGENSVNLPEMYTVQQVCEYLHTSVTTMYAWIKAGKIKAVKIGRFWYISKTEIERITQQGISV